MIFIELFAELLDNLLDTVALIFEQGYLLGDCFEEIDCLFLVFGVFFLISHFY